MARTAQEQRIAGVLQELLQETPYQKAARLLEGFGVDEADFVTYIDKYRNEDCIPDPIACGVWGAIRDRRLMRKDKG